MFDPALVKNVAGAGQQRNMLPERREFAMAVLVIFRAKGNSQDLLARYDATLADAIATALLVPKHFLRLHWGRDHDYGCMELAC